MSRESGRSSLPTQAALLPSQHLRGQLLLVTFQPIFPALATVTAPLPPLTLYDGKWKPKGASLRHGGFTVIRSAPWQTSLEALAFKFTPPPYTILKSIHKNASAKCTDLDRDVGDVEW